VCALCAHAPLAAQNLESIGKAKPFSIAGGISFDQVAYSSSGDSRRDPYRYVASGNVRLSLYGWDVPLSFTFSNHQTSFSQPFNQYAIDPTWKWITVHAGYTSASFSPYTVNGHTFLGGLIDLAPEGKLKVSALYGRFVRAVIADSTNGLHRHAAFQRDGYGLKASYGDGSNFINAILFHASDDVGSIPRPPDSLGIHPEENLVVSVGIGRRLFQHVILKAEAASSALSKDITAGKVNGHRAMDLPGFLFHSRSTSSYYQAFKASLDYQRNGWMLGFAWEHIDPEYRTLGAYYFNNDLENVTLNASGDLFKRKITFTSSGGIQRDNLANTKVSTMRRLVGSLNVSWMPTQRLSTTASYSSFQTFTNIRSPFTAIDQVTSFENLDTLNFTQTSRNASVSGMYVIRQGRDKTQTLSIHFSWQQAAESQGQASEHSDTQFWNLTTAYALTLVPNKLTMMIAFNGTRNKAVFMRTSAWGASSALTRVFFEGKLRTTLASSFNRAYSRGAGIHAITNVRLSGAFSVHRRHSVTLSAVVANRITAADQKSLTEFTGTLGYSYAFGTSN
jgi:hypothetical protein